MNTLSIWKVQVFKRIACGLGVSVYFNHKYDISENNCKVWSWANIINSKGSWNVLQLCNSNDNDTTLLRKALHNVEFYKQYTDIITSISPVSLMSKPLFFIKAERKNDLISVIKHFRMRCTKKEWNKWQPEFTYGQPVSINRPEIATASLRTFNKQDVELYVSFKIQLPSSMLKHSKIMMSLWFSSDSRCGRATYWITSTTSCSRNYLEVSLPTSLILAHTFTLVMISSRGKSN